MAFNSLAMPIAQMNQQNLTLREAGLRTLQARAQRAMVAGNLFPQAQQLSGSYTREQISIVQQPFLLPIPELFSRSFDKWSLAGNLSWELDIWGRFRRAVEAADANLEASVEEYDAILVCLIAEVVTAYVDIRTFEQRLEYARQNVRIQEGSLELAQARAEEGKTGDIGWYLSQSNLEATRASIPQLEIGLRQANNRLCTLLGLPTVDLNESLGAGDGIPSAPTEVEDSLVAFLRTQEQVRLLAGSVEATQRALELALINFKEGETDFTAVFVLQGDLVGKQDELAAAQGEVVTSLVSVYKALGGGWEIRCPNFDLRGINDLETEEILPPPVSEEEALPELKTSEAN